MHLGTRLVDQERARGADEYRAGLASSLTGIELLTHIVRAACRAHRRKAEGAMPTYATSTVMRPCPIF
jgi:hypothetical protein